MIQSRAPAHVHLPNPRLSLAILSLALFGVISHSRGLFRILEGYFAFSTVLQPNRAYGATQGPACQRKLCTPGELPCSTPHLTTHLGQTASLGSCLLAILPRLLVHPPTHSRCTAHKPSTPSANLSQKDQPSHAQGKHALRTA